MTGPHLDPTRRHDVVLMFDATDSNPNGDPDAARQPRTDDETGHGLVTDVAMKRRIRDAIPLLRPDDQRFGIFVESGYALNTRTEEAMKATSNDEAAAVHWLCQRYFDVRMFGAVLTRGKGSGGAVAVRGPAQMTFARTVDPVLPVEHAITRVTQSRQADIDKGERTEMGSKWVVPYGLYRAELHYSAPRAGKVGITGDDLAALWDAVLASWDLSRSTSSGAVEMCGLWIFSHDNAIGRAPARSLTDRIRPTLRTAGTAPRRYTDYELTIDRRMPAGVHLTTLMDVWSNGDE